jgi:Bacterial Ig domain
MFSPVRTRAVALALTATAALAAAPIADACRVRGTFVGLSPVPKRCGASAFTLTASASGRRTVTKVVVELDGRTIASSASRRVTARVDCGRLRAGEHSLVVTAYMPLGRAATRSAEFVRAR